MKTKNIILLPLVLISILSGCMQLNTTLNPEKNRFVGEWTHTYPFGVNSTGHLTYSFFSDATCSYQGTGGTWDIKDGRLVVDFNEDNTIHTAVYTYAFSENNTTLLLDGVLFIKQ